MINTKYLIPMSITFIAQSCTNWKTLWLLCHISDHRLFGKRATQLRICQSNWVTNVTILGSIFSTALSILSRTQQRWVGNDFVDTGISLLLWFCSSFHHLFSAALKIAANCDSVQEQIMTTSMSFPVHCSQSSNNLTIHTVCNWKASINKLRFTGHS